MPATDAEAELTVSQDDMMGDAYRRASDESRVAAAGRPELTRSASRVFLFDDRDRMLLIRRDRPGRPPYLTTPGGGVEPGESPDEAAVRETLEELGAKIILGPVAGVVWESSPSGSSVQRFYLARLLSIDPRAATGPEFRDPGRGTYELIRLELGDPRFAQLQPPEIRDLLNRHGAVIGQEARKLR
jgi:8-oxo-dGTP pyrophosphatase MutT (NUDIX family)